MAASPPGSAAWPLSQECSLLVGPFGVTGLHSEPILVSRASARLTLVGSAPQHHTDPRRRKAKEEWRPGGQLWEEISHAGELELNPRIMEARD